MEYEQDPDYEMLKNLFKTILYNNKVSKENFFVYDWDIENKNLNTITTSNTSDKEEKNFCNKYKYNNFDTNKIYRVKKNEIDKKMKLILIKIFQLKQKKQKKIFIVIKYYIIRIL